MMRELTLTETKQVSGGATATEYIILLRESSATSQVPRAQHDMPKTIIGNIR